MLLRCLLREVKGSFSSWKTEPQHESRLHATRGKHAPLVRLCLNAVLDLVDENDGLQEQPHAEQGLSCHSPTLPSAVGRCWLRSARGVNELPSLARSAGGGFMRTQSSPPAANTSLVQLAAPVNELQHQVIPNPNKVPGLRVCSTPPGVNIPESRRQFRSGHNYR